MPVQASPPKATDPRLPPGDSVWQTYSAHYELPLAGATSIFLHGLIIGLLAVGGIAFFFRFNQDAARPPSMDVVMIEGGGTGFEGLGGEPGLPGNPDPAGRTEQTASVSENTNPPTDARPQSLLPKEMPPELDIPVIDDGKLPMENELAMEIAAIAKEADDQVRKAMQLPPAPPAKTRPKQTSSAGTGNPTGQGGKGGTGGGPGLGNKQGPGTGTGGPPGRAATKQEIYAFRWDLNLGSDAKDHARILAAVRFVVAIPDSGRGFFVVTDVNRRPVQMRRDDLAAFKDAVKWYSMSPQSVRDLSRELQLPFVPRFVVLLLPRDREEKMAELEKKYADEHNRKMDMVRKTWFDFRLVNGSYEPIVTRQE